MEVTKVDLVKFMQHMQVNVEKLTLDIKRMIKSSNGNLEREIRE